MDIAAPAPHSKRPQSLHVVLLLGAVILASSAMVNPEFARVLIGTISDAYLQVTTFVAATLLIFYGIERLFGFDAIRLLSRSGKWQVPLAAALGALPGCGGAIIVVTNYVSGRLSFGAVMATLTATMGDAAFLLIAKEPVTGLIVMAVGLIVGTVSGYIVDFIHGVDFLRPNPSQDQLDDVDQQRPQAPRLMNRLWLIALVPGVVFGLLGAFQIDLDTKLATSLIAEPVTIFGFLAGCLCFGMWLLPQFIKAQDAKKSGTPSVIDQTITDTNFVTGWVIIAFLIFEVSIFATGYELATLFEGLALWVPLMAVLIGLLPGCGPQILVTTLYLSGVVPLSAQIGNAISNDGDALFPALALAPKAALIATIYSTIPALLLAYGWHFLMV